MKEGEAKRVEHLAGCGVAGQLNEVQVLAFAVSDVTDEGKAKVFEMNAHLMGATGVEDGFDERGVTETFHELVAGPGIATASVGDGHPFPMCGMAGYCGVNFALLWMEQATEQGVVNFSNAARAELGGEGEVGSIILGDDHAATGIAVKTMNDSRSGDAADPAELIPAMMQEGMHERAMLVAGRGMSDHPRRFVEHEQIIIFEQDPKRDWFGYSIGGLWGGPMDDDALAGFDCGRRFDGKIVDADMALVDKALDGSARERGESGG
jgi:hypothetical protein